MKSSIHALTKEVRTRRELFTHEAEILEGIAPVHAFLNAHAGHLVRKEPERLHEETLKSLINSTARRTLYDEPRSGGKKVAAGAARYERNPG